MKWIGRVIYGLGVALVLGAAVVLVLSIWSVLPWLGLGGQLFITLWISGSILALVSAVLL